MITLRTQIRNNTNDETNQLRFYIPPFLGVNANASLMVSAVIHLEKMGVPFKFTNYSISEWLNCSPALVTKLIKSCVAKDLIIISGSGPSRALSITKTLKIKLGDK